jgi:hypothetical protein
MSGNFEIPPATFASLPGNAEKEPRPSRQKVNFSRVAKPEAPNRRRVTASRRIAGGAGAARRPGQTGSPLCGHLRWAADLSAPPRCWWASFSPAIEPAIENDTATLPAALSRQALVSAIAAIAIGGDIHARRDSAVDCATPR